MAEPNPPSALPSADPKDPKKRRSVQLPRNELDSSTSKDSRLAGGKSTPRTQPGLPASGTSAGQIRLNTDSQRQRQAPIRPRAGNRRPLIINPGQFSTPLPSTGEEVVSTSQSPGLKVSEFLEKGGGGPATSSDSVSPGAPSEQQTATGGDELNINPVSGTLSGQGGEKILTAGDGSSSGSGLRLNVPDSSTPTSDTPDDSLNGDKQPKLGAKRADDDQEPPGQTETPEDSPAAQPSGILSDDEPPSQPGDQAPEDLEHTQPSENPPVPGRQERPSGQRPNEDSAPPGSSGHRSGRPAAETSGDQEEQSPGAEPDQPVGDSRLLADRPNPVYDAPGSAPSSPIGPLDKNGLSKAEKNAGGAAPASDEASEDGDSWYRPHPISNLKARRWIFNRRRALLGGGIVGTIVGLIFFFSLSAGPFEFIHIAQLMEQFHFSTQQNQQNDRFMHEVRFWRYASQGQIEKTRLGLLGNKLGNSFETQLNNNGLKSIYSDKFGLFNGYEIDTTSENSPYKNMSEEELKATIKADYGIDIVQAKDIPGISAGVSKTAWMIPGNKLSYLDTFKLNYALLQDAGYNNIASAIGARLLCVRAACTSFLHPITKLVGKDVKTAIEEYFSARNEAVNKGSGGPEIDSKPQQNDRTQTSANESTASSAANDVSEAAKSGDIPKVTDVLNAKLALKGASVVGIACVVKSLDSRYNLIKQAEFVLPLIRIGVEALALGSQPKAGQDMDAALMNAEGSYLTGKDSSGKTTSWYDAQSIQANLGHPNTGVPPNSSLTSITKASPFSGTVNKLNNLSGGHLNTICSAPGQITAAAVTLAIDFTGIGALAMTAFESVAIGYLQGPVIDQAAAWLAGSPINPVSYGADRGNQIDFGNALAANEQAAASGGRALSTAENNQLTLANNQLINSNFDSHSIAYKLFDPSDPRSAIARVIDNTSTSPTQNFAKIGSMFLNFGHLFSSIGSIFAPKASAAATSYNYGFPIYGFSASEMDSPAVQNPYQNAQDVENILNSSGGGTYIQRAKNCFSVDIHQVTDSDGQKRWDVTSQAGSTAQIYSSDYANYNCGDDSDLNWLKIRFFILDTETMNAMACYQGNDSNPDIAEACNDTGFGGATGGATPVNQAGSGGDSSSGSCSGSGKYAALVGKGSSFAGIDQGIDFIPSDTNGFDICAPASGTITLADQTGHQFDRTSGQALVVEKLDQSPGATSSSQYIYYAEIIQINSNIKVGAHVNKGDLIGHNAQSPGIEVGWATDSTHGFMCSLGSSLGSQTPCGESFNTWVQSQ